MLPNILEVLNGPGELPAVDGLSRLAGVLEGDTEVGAARPGALLGLDGGRSVAGLTKRDTLC